MNDLVERSINAAARLISEGRLDEAENICRQLLIVDESNSVAMRLLSCCLDRTGRKEESAALMDSVSRAAEGDGSLQNMIGISCLHARETHKALEHFKKASELLPESDDPKFNIGSCYMMLGKPDDALIFFSKSHELTGSERSMVGMACAKAEMLDLSGAEDLLRGVLTLSPNDNSARMNMSSVLFLRGKWSEAWGYYTSRLTHYERLARTVESMNMPLWIGGEPPKGRLLVFSEQGVGDSINFGRMVLRLMDKYPDRDFSVFVHPQLRSIMERQGLKTTSGTEGFDACLSMMDIPGLLGMSQEDIRKSFVRIVPERACDMSMFSGLFKIGVCWAGNPAHPKDAQRSCPLGMFRDICAMEGVKLFSLQRDVRPRVWPCSHESMDLSAGCGGMKLIDMAPHMNSWDDTAAIISGLDLVISVDTSIMHLAAAMSKETWGLLSYVPDWRWGLGSSDTCWYPTLRLFRQESYGDWSSVFSAVREELKMKL